MAENKRTKIKVPNVRVGFVSVFRPAERDSDDGDAKPTYELTMLMDKEQHADSIKEIQRTIMATARENYGQAIKPSQFKHSLRKGEEKEHLDGYDDNVIFLVCRTTRKPPVKDMGKRDLTEADGKPYSGCYCNVWLTFYTPKPRKDGTRWVSASLEGVQFVRDGEAFGGGDSMDDDDWEDDGSAGDDGLDWGGEDDDDLLG